MVLKGTISLLLIFSSLIVLTREQYSEQRSVADSVIAKKLKSAPQNTNCSITVNITSIQYQTLSMNTKDMQMASRVKLNMIWRDPGLGWNTSISNVPAIFLPVDKIWTPGLVFDNAIDVIVKPYSNEVQVTMNGTVEYAVLLFISVSCDINLFSYPFVKGDCPVAINGVINKYCSLQLNTKDALTTLIKSDQGEWRTENVNITREGNLTNRKYLAVTLSINSFSAIVTLILPSVLIMLADLVSFALPIQGGERSNLKVTLVLSFTMFLLILNDHLQGGGACSPLIHYHFCFCLVTLVLSMGISMVFTRLTVDELFLTKKPKDQKKPESKQILDLERDIDAIETTKSGHLPSEKALLQKIVNFLEDMGQKEKVKTSNETFVEFIDKICFYVFLVIYIIYVIIVSIVVTNDKICKNNNSSFWNNYKKPNTTDMNITNTNITDTDHMTNESYYESYYYYYF